MENKEAVLVLDGAKVGAPVPDVGVTTAPSFSPDNSRVGFMTVTGGHLYLEGYTNRARRRVVVDGRAGTEYNALGLYDFQFSPDSKHFAYGVMGLEKAGSLVVLDGAEGKRYDFVYPGTVKISSDAVCYVARVGPRFVKVVQAIP